MEATELGGERVVIEYEISDSGISPDAPAYVFFRVSKDSGESWNSIPFRYLRGDGNGIVETTGRKKIIWWGVKEMGFSDLKRVKVCIRGMRMIRVPGGEFVVKATPGGGYDPSKSEAGLSRRPSLPLFYIAQHEATISMYADYLNEVGRNGTGWNVAMSDVEKCGIEQKGSFLNYSYSVISGREKYPIAFVSWYDALSFLSWCGLRLPTEMEFEKAYRGGLYLDGDESKKQLNPNPDRKYPWGDEDPGEGGAFRCNMQGAEDGFAYTAPVCSFTQVSSPYGVCDLAGNVGEWTLDWYSTTFHVGLDGFRMVRGGSWRSLPSGVNALSGATSLPSKESAIMGFRGVAQ